MIAALIAALLAAPVPMPYGDALFPNGLAYAVSEDSCAGIHRCVWDARHQGNEDGQSVILTRYHGGYLMRPVSHRRAHWLQSAYCHRPQVTCDGYED